MNLDEVWGSLNNTPAPAETEAWVRRWLEDLRGARRRRVVFLVWTFVALTAMTALVGMTAVVKPSELTSAPATVILLAAQWAAFAFLLRQALAAGAVPPLGEATIRSSVERLHRDACDAARRTAALLALFAVAFPTLWAAVSQLQGAGKMAPHEASSAAVVLTGALTVGTCIVLFQRYRVALPRRTRLEALLRQYSE